MAKCYYSYSFDLEDGLIWEENLDKNVPSPMHAVGYMTPLDFDDYIDVWKDMCYPVFENDDDAKKLSRRYFEEAYARGETTFSVDLEHNPLKNTYAAKYTRVRVRLFEDEESKRVRALVMWEENSEMERSRTKQ